MRQMSFYLTQNQFRNRTMTVTRRFNCDAHKAGDVVMGVEQISGLEDGEDVAMLGPIRILSNRREKVSAIVEYPSPLQELARSGFMDITVETFIDRLCRANKKTPADMVNRIEFEYIDEPQGDRR